MVKHDLKNMSNEATEFANSRQTTVNEVPCSISGKRSYEIRGVTFTVHEKYKILKAIGVGAYGVVTAAIDTETEQKVALKKISGVFEDLTDAKRVLREIRLMQALEHENVSLQQKRSLLTHVTNAQSIAPHTY